MKMGFREYRDIHVLGNSPLFFMRHIALILLYVTSCSAIFNFQETLSISLDGSSDIWQGSPSAFIRSDKKYRICADDIYWSDEIADSICRYRGFDGAMIIKEYPSNSGYDYAVCNLAETGRTPLVCDSIDVCDKAPVISCLLPGYQGCFTHTESSPFFTNAEQAPSQDEPYNIQTCAEACVQYPYMGLTNGQICICGSALDDQGKGVCDLGCLEDELQLCGGVDSISVFAVGGFTGQCSSSQASQDLLPNETLFVLSPNFPDSFSAGATCQWTLSINVQESHNLEVTATADLLLDASIEVSSKSGYLYTILYGTQGTSGLTFYPYSVFQDTITVDFTSHGVLGGGSFLIRFSLTPSVVKSTFPPFVTDSSIRHTLASPSPTKLRTNSPDMPPPSSDSFPSSSSSSSTNSSPSSIGSSSTKTLPESARSINEQAIFAGVGVAVAVVILLALGIIFVLFRGRIGRTFAKSTAEKPAGLVGYHHGVVDVVNTAYATPTSLPSGQPGNEEVENHIYATIPDDQYLVPDAFNNGQVEDGKLNDDSSETAAERKLNDYDV
eukprot:XP_011667059.1 PREDICTED: uncharacterized protein in LEU2 3'region isoform X2 [Strongylocentrotus purpuratus]